MKPARQLWLGLLAALPVGASGCARGPALVVVTNWSAAECAGLESKLDGLASITWVQIMPGDDPTRAVGRFPGADLVLGGSVSAYRRLAGNGLLASADGAGRPAWRVARRSTLGVAINRPAREARGIPEPEDPADLTPPVLAGLVALDDPRRSPATLAWARARLDAGPWSEGYAALVRTAANARRIGPIAGAALADLRRGDALATPAVGPGNGRGPVEFRPLSGHRDWVEGIGVLATSRDPGRALAVLATVAGPVPTPGAEDDPDADGLLADLLGATLVDAQEELWAARAALARSGWPDQATRWMTEAPTWPPASVEKIKRKSDHRALLKELADQMALDDQEHAWLLESWARPPAVLDGGRLAGLAGAVGGRLAANPRFRSWLRGEWTAWARQRYRRVARLVEGRP